MSEATYDVVVVGGGSAGLCAALAAHQRQTRVLLIDKCPKPTRGGNTRLSSGGFRFTYGNLEDIRPLLPDLSDEEAERLDIPSYESADYCEDVMRATEYLADKKLTTVLAAESYPTVRWLKEMNVKWRLSARSGHSIKVGEKIRFPAGRVISVKDGGQGLVETLFQTAENKGIDTLYEAKALSILFDKKQTITGIKIQTNEGVMDFQTRSVVLASGGFEANAEMRAKYLGAGWDMVKVRGSRYNTGETLKLALAAGAKGAGQWTGCHAVLLNANAPDVEAVHEQMFSYPYGIMVDTNGRRFVDEGEDVYNRTYGRLGREVLRLPGKMAFQIFDQKVVHLLRSEYKQDSAVSADSIESLGRLLLSLNWENLVTTIKQFNEAVQEGQFNPSRKDGKHTQNITPAKSNWAQRLDSPPYYAYPVTCGITFTFGGLRITEKAEVCDTEDKLIRGLFAAGEITGGSFYHNYPGGSALTKGAVFGKIAGFGAASYSKAASS